ncbi:MAG: RimK family alpha-L-glutamate ligase [Corynebacterium sp.]|nr:RimK family alpha-L-glutamate ligase [Corynebacterium sp.]
MKTAWMLTNSWLVWDKFEQQYADLVAAAARQGIDLVRLGNDEVAGGIEKLEAGKAPRPDFVLNMDKDVAVLRVLEAVGLRTINTAAAVAECDNKALTYAALRAAHLPQPRTLVAPTVFRPLSAAEWEHSKYVAAVERTLPYPVVVKEAVGSWGTGVFLAYNRAQLVDHLSDAGTKAVLVQEFISAARGKDVRLYLLGRKVVAAMERSAPGDDFRANVTGGGSAQPCVPTLTMVETARRAMDAVGLDFGSVDFLIDDTGTELICEVNSNAQFVTLSAVTGVDVADAMMTWLSQSS